MTKRTIKKEPHHKFANQLLYGFTPDQQRELFVEVLAWADWNGTHGNAIQEKSARELFAVMEKTAARLLKHHGPKTGSTK